MYRLIVIFIALITLSASSSCIAQSSKDSATQVISNISLAYKKGVIPEKKYLDTIHKNMQFFLRQGILFTNKELLTLLSQYREAIWNSEEHEEGKYDYYGILSNQAQMSGNLGEMRYYAEKINELEQKKRNQPSITALTIIADYYNTLWSYKNTQDLFLANKKFILDIPQQASQSKLNISQLVQTSFMLDKFGEALFKLKDTINGRAVETVLEQINAIAKSKYSTQYYELAHIAYSKLHVDLSRGNGINSSKIVRESLQQFGKFQLDEHTPDDLKDAAISTITDAKIVLFLDEKNVDSALHYIESLTNIMGTQPNLYNRYMVQKYKSRVLYEQGLYKQSIDTLIDAMLISENIRKEIVKDVNEMMYAQAQAEEQELLLREANQKRSDTERHLLIAGIAIVVLLLLGIFIIRLIRRKQRNRFIEFKLNMARNIHDETGPALLYAHALAKANRNTEFTLTKSELEKQIERTMEVIRHLSHDLKSENLVTLFDLVQDIKTTLNKLNPNHDFSYDINENIDKKQFISHLQFTQIRAILNECITNTIKHADFKNIRISLKQNGNKLTISYDDDGQGWQLNPDSSGIGIKNIEERVLQLNGTWNIENRYPEGYNINIGMILR
jgi:signal transduction histidine kinase